MFGEACGCWLVALLGVGTLVAISAGIRTAIRNRGITPGEVHCPRCKYNLRGIVKPTCPECGCDLIYHGIRTANDEPPMGLGERVLAWSVFFVGPGMLLAFVAGQVTDAVKTGHTYGWTGTANHYMTDFSVHLRAVTSTPTETPSRIAVRFTDRGREIERWEVETDRIPDASTIIARLHGAGQFPEPEEAANAARDVIVMLDAARAMRSVSSLDMRVLRGDGYPTVHLHTREMVRPLVGIIAFILIVGLWIGGSVWISRDYDRAVREHRQRKETAMAGFIARVEAAAKESGRGSQ